MASNNNIPIIPPRPVRAKSPANAPVVPPRPSRGPKSPDAALESRTIPETTELQQPVPVPAAQQRPAAITKESNASSTTSSAAPSTYKHSSESTENVAAATQQKDSTGIPYIGRRVPMYPNAGDVQAPTPGATPSSGKKKHVYREEWEMDEGAYGAGKTKTPYSMSSTDLNAVVAQSESPGVGVNAESEGVPDEEMGYLAAEEYVRTHSRSQSPVLERKPDTPQERSSVELHEHHHHDRPEVIHVDSPHHGAGYLRRGNVEEEDEPEKTSGEEVKGEDATTDDVRQEVYSILAEDEMLKRQNRHMQAAISPRGGTPRSRPRSVVIEKDEGDIMPSDKSSRPSLDVSSKSLTSRDAIKTPYETLSPAEEGSRPLFPESDDEAEDKEDKPSNPAVSNLRRPGLSEQRFPSNDVWEEAPDHAQLSATVDETSVTDPKEEEEYVPEKHRRPSTEKEPQYVSGQPHQHYVPGDERELLDEHKPKKSDYEVDLSQLPEDERLRRLINPDAGDKTSDTIKGRQSGRKFPSKDVWEEAPESLDLEATVEPTPLPDKEPATTGDVGGLNASADSDVRPTSGAALEKTDTNTSAPFEKTDTNTPAPLEKTNTNTSAALEKTDINTSVPLEKIDTNTSAPLKKTDTNTSAPLEKTDTNTSAPLEKTSTNTSATSVGSATTKLVAPPRPQREKPTIPERPKPKVPARPAKPPVLARLPSHDVPAASTSPEKREKPAPPPRVGGKIAALKAGLGDLESRLRFGPFAPKKEEPAPEPTVEAEPKALEHATKSRARGPKRRAPTTAPPAAAKEEKKAQPKKVELGFSQIYTVFTLDEDLDAVVIGKAASPQPNEESKAATVSKDSPAPASSSAAAVEQKEAPSVAPVTEEKEAPDAAPVADGKEDPGALVAEEKKPEPESESPSKPPAETGSPTAVAEKESSPATASDSAPATTTLPGAQSTGTASDVATTRSTELPSSSPSTAAPADEKKEEKENPTLIPSAQHPEDAVAPLLEKDTESETLKEAEKEKQEEEEEKEEAEKGGAQDKAAVFEGDVNTAENTTVDERGTTTAGAAEKEA